MMQKRWLLKVNWDDLVSEGMIHEWTSSQLRISMDWIYKEQTLPPPWLFGRLCGRRIFGSKHFENE